MASLRPRPLSLMFVLFVLCMHLCSARKVLMDDLKQDDAQVHVDKKSPSLESDPLDPGIGLECGSLGCGSPYVEIPQPPHIFNPQPIIVPTPPQIVPLPPHQVYPLPIIEPTPPIIEPIPRPPCTTPCEPWYGPGPCPCEPCEEGAADKEGVKTEANESNNKAQKGEKLIRPGKEKQDGAKQAADEPMPPMSSSELTWKMADAPTPASYINNGGSELHV